MSRGADEPIAHSSPCSGSASCVVAGAFERRHHLVAVASVDGDRLYFDVDMDMRAPSSDVSVASVVDRQWSQEISGTESPIDAGGLSLIV
jgi:hypothetical protein